jgi:PIN domain nuclease of toxin-antitoxin system
VSERFFITDTHPFVWYISKQFAKLPKKVTKAFQAAKEGSGTHIWIPQIVLWELSVLLKKTSRITIKISLQKLIRNEFYSKNISIIDLDNEDIIQAHSMTFTSDPFDALIMASAHRLKVPLITGDREIHTSKQCEIFW